MIVLAVFGGRDFDDRTFIFKALDTIHAELVVRRLVHGACGWEKNDRTSFAQNLRGADRHAHEWARLHKIEVMPYPAAWAIKLGGHGGGAGRIRTREMLDTECPDLGVIFPGGPGTRIGVSECRARKIPLRSFVKDADWSEQSIL